MRILLVSWVYPPSIGGIEQVSVLLAREFKRAGHEVRVVTHTTGEATDSGGPVVRRRPSPWRLLADVHWSEVVFHNNVSLRFAWPLLFLRRPWVVAHHVWIPQRGVAAALKRAVLRRAVGIAPSQALADHLPGTGHVVGNPYDANVFFRVEAEPRTADLVFLGRLVSDKGVDLLLEALALLRQQHLAPRLTIIGDGPERPALQAQAEAAGLSHQVSFLGPLSGEPLRAALARHRVIVMPSRWAEPFGIVALEGMACGCVPIGSSGGGLAEALGNAGLVFQTGSAQQLAACIASLLADETLWRRLQAAGAAQLREFHPATVAARYLTVLEAAHAV